MSSILAAMSPVFYDENIGFTPIPWDQTGTTTPRYSAYFSRGSSARAVESKSLLERAMGIEPTSEAWEALNKTLKATDLAALSFSSDSLNWKLDGN
jgi:hypothetical protein